MPKYPRAALAAGCFLVFFAARIEAADIKIRHLESSTNESEATLRVFADQQSPYRIPAFVTGKFAEHLGENIYGGMFAQILRNPTLADYPFATREVNPDGVMKFHSDREGIDRALRQFATRWGWPESELAGLATAYDDALAAFWTREGPRGDVQPSPDTGLFGGRAQRVQVKAPGQGIAQWTYLPLHRVRKFEFEILARAPDVSGLSISLTPAGTNKPAASAVIRGLSPQWKKFTGVLELDPALPADTVCKLAVTADAPGQFVIQHIFLQPADNIHGADPDIIRLLRESHLPLLRWPGGNFVSGYHWQDGVGPVEQRPTKPNYAWGGIEPNLFGTDEFIEFCRAVGCEPMICINAGDGTPEEAAQWVEYCNGAVASPMGKLRAANGHPEPYGIKYWEIGNELWGRWQFNWTTASGYVDRYQQFAPAMLKADPTLKLLACGAPVLWGKSWNDTLIAGLAPGLRSITDHPLIGGEVSPATDPLDVYRDFMAVPEILEKKWSALRGDMLNAGVREPRMALTELQLFANIGSNRNPDAPARLTRGNLPNQGSITEAVYDILIYHAAIRLGPFVELVTHSAIVNHGGGLRKEHERVFANPCYYAQAGFSVFADATPVAVEITSSTHTAPRVIADLQKFAPEAGYSDIDAMAAIGANGDLLISIVNRNVKPIHLTTGLSGFNPAGNAEVWTLQAAVPWAANSLDKPDAIKPRISTAPVAGGTLKLDLQPYSVVRVSIPPRR